MRFFVAFYQHITDLVKLTGREEHIGELPGFAGTSYLFCCYSNSSHRCCFENHSPNKWFHYNRIHSVGFSEIGLQTFGLSYNDILCLFNLFSYLNTCICSQSNLFTLQSLDREVDSEKKIHHGLAGLLPCRLLDWPWLAGWRVYGWLAARLAVRAAGGPAGRAGHGVHGHGQP